MNHRRATGRVPGRHVTGFVTFLTGLCLAFAAVAVAGPPARAGMLPASPNDPTVEASQDAPGFVPQRIGTRSAAHTWVFRNTGVLPLSMGEVTLERGYQGGLYGVDDDGGRAAFSAVTDCPDTVLLPQATCRVDVTFAPLRPGQSTATLKVAHDGVSGGWFSGLTGDGTVGIYIAGAFGEVLTYGDAQTHGDLSNVAIQSPVLGIATTPSGEGYWLMEAAGRVHRFGDAADIGSPSLAPGEYAISLEATPTGKGYWIATQKGGVRAMGDAGYFGSATGLGPDVDVIGIAATPSALGYWLLDSAGGVHAFGDAAFFGSAASLPPKYPVTTMAPTPTGKGYWIVDAVGGVFAYGDATAFPRDNTYAAYSTDTALNDAVMSAETAPYGPGQGFIFVRLLGGFGAQGVYLGISNPAYLGYGGGKFQEGSFAIDLALNVAAVQPSSEAGAVARREGLEVRAPQEVCALVVCAGPPGLPETPAPPAAPALPAVPPIPAVPGLPARQPLR